MRWDVTWRQHMNKQCVRILLVDAGFVLAPPHRPDLVFLDIGQPRMNGHELARAAT